MILAVKLSFSTLFVFVFLMLDVFFVKYIYGKSLDLDNRSFLLLVISLALLIRIVSVFVVSQILVYFLGEPFLGGGDDNNYYEASVAICHYWDNGFVSLVGSGIPFSTGAYSGYPIFGALMMKLFGTNIYSARIGNAVVSTLTVILVYLICDFYAPKRLVRLVTCIFALYPMSFVMASLQLKDTLLLFFVLLETYGVIAFVFSRHVVLPCLFTIISLVILLVFRPAVTIVLLVGVVILILYLLLNSTKYYAIVKVVGKLVVLVLIATVFLFSLWGNLSDAGYVSETEDYIGSRYAISGKSLSETDAKGATESFAKYFGPPLYIISTPFFPVFSAFNYSDGVNIDYASIIIHMSLLPFFIMGLFNVLFRGCAKDNIVAVYLVINYAAYRILQSFSSLSTFSLRQSMPALIFMLLLLPFAFARPLSRKVRTLSIFVSVLMLLAFNFVRMRSHGIL